MLRVAITFLEDMTVTGYHWHCVESHGHNGDRDKTAPRAPQDSAKSAAQCPQHASITDMMAIRMRKMSKLKCILSDICS